MLSQTNAVRDSEDTAKITDEYPMLVSKYGCVQLITHGGVTFPEECLWLSGKDGEFDAVIDDHPDKHYVLPKIIADHSGEIMKAHSSSIVYDQVNIRLDDVLVDAQSGRLEFRTSRTTYFDSLLTNRACDYVFGEDGVTCRELFEPGPSLSPLAESQMSNHLGFNGFIITCDGKIPFVLRKKSLSIGKNQWGPSIGASLKSKYALSPDGQMLSENAFGLAIMGEIRDELHLTQDDDIALSGAEAQKSIFAVYRDLVECGKPQLLFYLQLRDVSADRLQSIISEKKTSDDDVSTDGDVVQFFTVEQLEKAKLFVDKIAVEGKEYKMMPSSVVSIVLLLRHLKLRF